MVFPHTFDHLEFNSRKMWFRNFLCGQMERQNENKDMYDLLDSYGENGIIVGWKFSDLNLSKPQIPDGRAHPKMRYAPFKKY